MYDDVRLQDKCEIEGIELQVAFAWLGTLIGWKWGQLGALVGIRLMSPSAT
jgi:hypothetical protein